MRSVHTRSDYQNYVLPLCFGATHFVDTIGLMAKLVLAVTVAALVTISLSRIDQLEQVSYAPVVQAGGGGINN